MVGTLASPFRKSALYTRSCPAEQPVKEHAKRKREAHLHHQSSPSANSRRGVNHPPPYPPQPQKMPEKKGFSCPTTLAFLKKRGNDFKHSPRRALFIWDIREKGGVQKERRRKKHLRMQVITIDLSR